MKIKKKDGEELGEGRWGGGEKKTENLLPHLFFFPSVFNFFLVLSFLQTDVIIIANYR